MLIKNLYADLLDNPLPNVVYLQCHDKQLTTSDSAMRVLA